MEEIELSILNFLNRVKLKISYSFNVLRRILLLRKNRKYNFKVGDKYIEIDRNYRGTYIFKGFHHCYYPQVGIKLERIHDPTIIDIMSVTRFERDFKKIK